MTDWLILGITGPAGSGKSAAARILRENYGLSEITFATPIKRACCAVFDWELDRFEGSRKEGEDRMYGISPREAMQRMGDALRSAFGADVLIKAADLEYIYQLQQSHFAATKTPGWIFSDVRTEAEAAFVRAKGGVLIHIHRTVRSQVHQHHTERGVSFAPGDYPVANDDTLGALEQTLAMLVFNLMANKVSA